MNNKAECLILRRPDESFSAWSNTGRWLGTCGTWSFLDEHVRALGYEPVPMNSRAGRSIIDRLCIEDRRRLR